MRTCQDNSVAYFCYAVKPNKNNGVIASKPEHLLPLLFHKQNKLVSFWYISVSFQFFTGYGSE